MKRTARLTCAAALAAVSFSFAGCAWMYAPRDDVSGGQFQYRPGTGVVESVARAPAPFTAAAGGTSAPDDLYRLTIRMDDGRQQYLDTSDASFQRGTRVRLTESRLIEKL